MEAQAHAPAGTTMRRTDSRLGGSAARRLGGSAARRLGGSAARRLGGSAARRLGNHCTRNAACACQPPARKIVRRIFRAPPGPRLSGANACPIPDRQPAHGRTPSLKAIPAHAVRISPETRVPALIYWENITHPGRGAKLTLENQQFPLAPWKAVPQCDFGAISTAGAPDRGDFESIFRLSGNCCSKTGRMRETGVISRSASHRESQSSGASCAEPEHRAGRWWTVAHQGRRGEGLQNRRPGACKRGWRTARTGRTPRAID